MTFGSSHETQNEKGAEQRKRSVPVLFPLRTAPKPRERVANKASEPPTRPTPDSERRWSRRRLFRVCERAPWRTHSPPAQLLYPNAPVPPAKPLSPAAFSERPPCNPLNFACNHIPRLQHPISSFRCHLPLFDAFHFFLFPHLVFFSPHSLALPLLSVSITIFSSSFSIVHLLSVFSFLSTLRAFSSLFLIFKISLYSLSLPFPFLTYMTRLFSSSFISTFTLSLSLLPLSSHTSSISSPLLATWSTCQPGQVLQWSSDRARSHEKYRQNACLPSVLSFRPTRPTSTCLCLCFSDQKVNVRKTPAPLRKPSTENPSQIENIKKVEVTLSREEIRPRR